MNKFIIASCIIALTFGWTTSTLDYCSCDDYKLEGDCLDAYRFGCEWNVGTTSTCQKVNCTNLPISSCLSYGYGCQINNIPGANSTCVPFTQCSSLKGANDTACQGQNGQCIQPTPNANDKTACAYFKCSLYNSTNCPLLSCYNNGTTCSEQITCTGLDFQKCSALLNSCYYNGTTCQAAVCGNFGIHSCKYVKTSATTLQPCFWNSTACVDAPGSANLVSTTCFTNTLGAYHWSSTNAMDGSCIFCYGVLLQIMFAIILLLA